MGRGVGGLNFLDRKNDFIFARLYGGWKNNSYKIYIRIIWKFKNYGFIKK